MKMLHARVFFPAAGSAVLMATSDVKRLRRRIGLNAFASCKGSIPVVNLDRVLVSENSHRRDNLTVVVKCMSYDVQ